MRMFLLICVCFAIYLLFSITVYGQVSNVENDSKEIHIGWEIFRESLGGFVGYQFRTDEHWGFVPELTYTVGLTLSGSLRYEIRFTKKVVQSIQFGLGATPIFPQSLKLTTILGIGTNYAVNKNFSISVSGRVLFFSDSQNISLGGAFSSSKIKELTNYPPIIIAVGLIIN